jgi:hypothetical protein
MSDSSTEYERQKEVLVWKSKFETTPICFSDTKGFILYEFAPPKLSSTYYALARRFVSRHGRISGGMRERKRPG